MYEVIKRLRTVKSRLVRGDPLYSGTSSPTGLLLRTSEGLYRQLPLHGSTETLHKLSMKNIKEKITSGQCIHVAVHDYYKLVLNSFSNEHIF